MPGRLRVLLFARAREAIGRSRIDLDLPPRGRTVGEVVASLGREHPPLKPILPTCRFARNGEYVRTTDERLRPGDELAIHPPYGGG